MVCFIETLPLDLMYFLLRLPVRIDPPEAVIFSAVLIYAGRVETCVVALTLRAEKTSSDFRTAIKKIH